MLLDVAELELAAALGRTLAPKEISEHVDMPEDELYRLVAWVLDELEPAPGGDTMRDIYARQRGRPATGAELEEFEHHYGPSPPPDGEG